MRLYYKDDIVEIWNGDSRRLSVIEDEKVDLVLTSPPWWNGGDYRHPAQVGFGQSYGDFIADLTKIHEECLRCLRPGGRIVSWVADILHENGRPRIPLSADAHGSLRQAGFEFETTIFWHTPMPVSAGKTLLIPLAQFPRGGPQHLLVYRKRGSRPAPTPSALAASQIPRGFLRQLTDSVWIGPAGGAPSELGEEGLSPEWGILRFWSLVGDTVLDPFAGTAGFLAAAKRLGRKAVGVELNESICAEAAERCRKAISFSNLTTERTDHADS